MDDQKGNNYSTSNETLTTEYDIEVSFTLPDFSKKIIINWTFSVDWHWKHHCVKRSYTTIEKWTSPLKSRLYHEKVLEYLWGTSIEFKKLSQSTRVSDHHYRNEGTNCHQENRKNQAPSKSKSMFLHY